MARGLSIVIPTWNGLSLLREFLPSVIAEARSYCHREGAPVEIMVVEDGGDDSTVEWLVANGFEEKAECAEGQDSLASERDNPSLEFRFIRNRVNLGFGEASNHGVRAARHPLVFLLNNDVELAPDCIAPLVERFCQPSVFAVHCRVFDLETGRECGTGKVGTFARGFLRVHQSYALLDDEEPERKQVRLASDSSDPLYSMFAGGGSALFDRSKFLELGGFEQLLSPFYWEDVDLSYRAWKRGLTVLYEPKSVVRHRISSTIRKLDRQRVRRIQQRNRLIWHWINLHDRKLMISHLAWLVLLSVTAPLTLRPGFIGSLVSAARLLPEIRQRRREEESQSIRSDRDVLGVFEQLNRRADLKFSE
jgi:GT2 family glycosyltransferase